MILGDRVSIAKVARGSLLNPPAEHSPRSQAGVFYWNSSPAVGLKEAEQLHQQLTTNKLHPHHKEIELFTNCAVILKVSRGRPHNTIQHHD